MKKLLILVCMITCVFGLTACGSEEALTEYEQQKITYAENLASQSIVPMLQEYMGDDTYTMFDEYTSEEIEDIFESYYELQVEGYALKNAVSSFHSALSSMGNIVQISSTSAEIHEDQIIVTVEIDGEKKDGYAEIIFSNDRFMVLESASLNPDSSMSELMERAALNTVIGMGTVFVILILISLLISLLGFIPKIQEKNKKSKDIPELTSKNQKENAKVNAKEKSINNTISQIVEKEENTNLVDDMELVAVISAAIAAFEGSQTTEGFVVRSIRKNSRPGR